MWQDIKGFNGVYQVNKKLGKIRSVDRYLTKSNSSLAYSRYGKNPYITDTYYKGKELTSDKKDRYTLSHEGSVVRVLIKDVEVVIPKKYGCIPSVKTPKIIATIGGSK